MCIDIETVLYQQWQTWKNSNNKRHCSIVKRPQNHTGCYECYIYSGSYSEPYGN